MGNGYFLLLGCQNLEIAEFVHTNRHTQTHTHSQRQRERESWYMTWPSYTIYVIDIISGYENDKAYIGPNAFLALST